MNVWVCACVCVCGGGGGGGGRGLHPFTLKASSVWNSWNGSLFVEDALSLPNPFIINLE